MLSCSLTPSVYTNKNSQCCKVQIEMHVVKKCAFV